MKGGPGRPLTRALALVAGALGLGALRRALRRGRADDPAAGLRAKLDETRRTPAPPPVEEGEPEPAAGVVEDTSVGVAAEPAAAAEAEEIAPDVDRRREDVHARARQAIDELRS